MSSFKRVLVPLNLGGLDATCVRYAGMISRVFGSERVYFVHIAKQLEYPDSILDDLPELGQVPRDMIEGVMRDTVGAHFGSPEGDADIRYEDSDGSVVEELLRRVRRFKIDLIITGKGAGKQDAGDVPEKLARKSPCSVLVVPERSEPRISRILVPLDYSDHSSRALRRAMNMARAVGNASLICLHAFTVPPVYVQIGKTYEEFTEIIKGHAAKAFEAYIRDFDVGGLSVTPLFVPDERPSTAIEKTIESGMPDLVVMGARGRTDVAAVLLGSTTERVIRRTTVPVLAVKKKGEGMSFLEALLSD